MSLKLSSMDFSLTDEQNDLLNSLDNTIQILMIIIGWIVIIQLYPKELLIQWLRRWLGIAMPTNYGGSNLGVTEASLMMMLVAEKGGMTAASSIHEYIGPSSIVKFASKKQKNDGYLILLMVKVKCVLLLLNLIQV